jgi:hypothetical protein
MLVWFTGVITSALLFVTGTVALLAQPMRMVATRTGQKDSASRASEATALRADPPELFIHMRDANIAYLLRIAIRT